MTMNAREDNMPVAKKQSESMRDVSQDLVSLLNSIDNAVEEVNRLLFVGEHTPQVAGMSDGPSSVQRDLKESRDRAQDVLKTLELIISKII